MADCKSNKFYLHISE